MTAKKMIEKIKPEVYAEASVVAREVGEHMMKQLEFMSIHPKVVVDLGCGVGNCAQLLKNHYPDAIILGIDRAEMMLMYAKQETSDKVSWICAEAGILPLPDASVDMIFGNFLLPWFDDLKSILAECRRVLRPEGLLMISSLGPDTLLEWNTESILPNLIDMHDLGDELIHARFADPVLDVDYLTVTYKEIEKLLYELQVTGMIDLDQPPPWLEPDDEGKFAVTYEVIYAHAWGPAETVHSVADEPGVVKIPLSHLINSRKQKS